MAHSERRRLRIAICGGGPGGLALSVVLGKLKADVDVDLYEALPQFTEIGAGISIWKRTWFIIKDLGLEDSLGKMAVRPPTDEIKPGFILRKSNQPENGFTFYQMLTPYGSITLHRRDMLKVLLENMPPSEMFTAHFNKRLVSYSQGRRSDGSDGVTLFFEDGTMAEADMLAGADGIKSAVRASMFKSIAARNDDPHLLKHVKAEWSGTYGYRCLVNTEKFLSRLGVKEHLIASEALFYCGSDRHVVSYPISQGTLINIVAFVTVPGGEGTDHPGPAMIEVPKQEMLDQYEGWEPDLLTLLDCAEKTSRWTIFQVRHLPTFVDGRVCIMGDAANGMTTHLGAGAGQAIEGAYILGHLLANLPKACLPIEPQTLLPNTLKVYDAIRRPFASRVVETSRRTGFLYEFSQPNPSSPINGPVALPERELLDSGDMEALKKLGEKCFENWSLQWTDMPDGEREKAEKMLQEELWAST